VSDCAHEVLVVVEIPKGSRNKYEYDPVVPRRVFAHVLAARQRSLVL
jgi:inorganic pyrophosphatase